jgi:enamine deaminase RidA (YjgF/YER057c/UK114 family)
MPERVFVSPPTLHAPFGYTHAVGVTPGRLVFVSGQIAMDVDGNVVDAADPEAHVRQAFTNLGRALDAASARWQDVVKLTYFVVDMSVLPVLRRVRDELVDTQQPPASTLVQVAGLALPGLLLEVEAVACVSA